MDEWDPFLHEQIENGERKYSICHASFRDFLHRREIVQQAGVTIAGMHDTFANPLFEELFAGRPRATPLSPADQFDSASANSRST